jgi:predicted ATP-grasp superfamily ATP-dependent carboligase
VGRAAKVSYKTGTFRRFPSSLSVEFSTIKVASSALDLCEDSAQPCYKEVTKSSYVLGINAGKLVHHMTRIVHEWTNQLRASSRSVEGRTSPDIYESIQMIDLTVAQSQIATKASSNEVR